MDIGVVVHGPNIIDSGYAKIIIDYLRDFGSVSARLGGTMGRTAVIDSSLENVIDISRKLVPSESLKLFNDDGKDMIFLLNYGKSDVTGQVFGYKVVNHYFDKIKENDIPLIQIERPGEDDGSVILWNGDAEDVADEIACKFNLNRVTPEEIYEKHFGMDFEDNRIHRLIHGVSPGENIMVNSVIIGKSTSDRLVLIAEDGYIVDIEGGILKPHGVEKLSKVDLDKAIIKTGLLRKSDVKPRILEKGSENESYRVAFVDHAGEDIYRYRDADLVVTVGDDTTLISSDILYRFEIPIIGITDGDLDKVVEHGFKTPGSIIFELESGFDDVAGKEIFNGIFNNSPILEFGSDEKIDMKQAIIEILNNMNCKYKLKVI
ncbi:MAG: DUF2117 domain-containing protein [Methanobrevibacter sp.]|uniref:DUF2117 domain-containing protein n=1 Tax=Methanobrevibacter sp. TaxID=66852 RepID=UPI0026E10C76|nr:DUF2117 domain-containing protein [Methanobrevibacter sp.]MDO5848856.1 DUF2117 domain-containing protein [Methanobrevibacter sp.]